MQKETVCQFLNDAGERVCSAPATHTVALSEYVRQQFAGVNRYSAVDMVKEFRYECVNHAAAEVLRNTYTEVRKIAQ